ALGFLITTVNISGLISISIGLLILIRISEMGIKSISRVIKAGIFLGGFYILVMGWTWEGWTFWQGNWSYEGLLAGVIMAWRILLVFILTRIFTGVTSPSEQGIGIAYLFTPFYPLTKKAADFALLLTLTLRFIPLLLEEGAMLYKARLAKGSLPTNWGGKVQEITRLLFPLLRITFRRAEELGENLLARGYVSGGYRVLATKEWDQKDTIGVVLILIWGTLTLVLNYWYNPLP
ncbi:MAG: energy-coupling factor transporter transmembrane protein EcfT, partial [Desulfitobacterium sp.]|nr:energy-coupling factor transporter transmembrane protein EcfT [Desulfitobacterium sp.]